MMMMMMMMMMTMMMITSVQKHTAVYFCTNWTNFSCLYQFVYF